MRHQSGFSVLSLLFVAVAMLAGLAFALTGRGPGVQGQLNAQKTAELVAQAQLTLHRITKCATDHPGGDNGTAWHKAYPRDAQPGSLAATALVCPGNGQNLWSGVDGVYAPAPIAGFAPWVYSNGSTALISITTPQPAAHAEAIAAAAQRLGPAATVTTTLTAGDTLSVKVIE